ncbi:replication protein [Peribacillus frigoritolerans]|uniref:replication protein n=1 Tax=Peribacillus frigoritolerans TaxID=450367 RepID=UPI0032B38F59
MGDIFQVNEESDFGSKLMFWTEQIVCRDFTKRQLKIFSFLMLFMVNNKRMECHIPTLISFEAAGISRHKIRYEIEKLEEVNVLSWDQANMIFKLNIDAGKWKVGCLKKNERIKQILDLNEAMYLTGPR